MKKQLFVTIIILCVFAPQVPQAQTLVRPLQILDTIYANDTKNVALFFPEPIRQGITGSENFVFTYNRENEQYFGLLQAKPGKESNLLVINRNGSVFSYIVKYKAKLSTLNYFIPISNSIGNEKPKLTESVPIEVSEKKVDYGTYYYENFSKYLLDSKQRIGHISSQVEGIVLSVKNIVFDKGELYFVIQIMNTSTLVYDLNFLKFSIETRQKGKRKSLQRIYQEPLFEYQVPTKILEHGTVKFVYVMSKFSLSNDRRVILELNEKDGERNIELKISHKHINNPN